MQTGLWLLADWWCSAVACMRMGNERRLGEVVREAGLGARYRWGKLWLWIV